MNRIVMGTSLAPYNFEKQMIAIKSWIENGFDVVSFNCSEEIEILRPYFQETGVQFVEIERDASEEAGKRIPYIQDILEGAGERSEHICGFFNSDIFLGKMTPELYRFIYNEANQSLVFTRRNEVTDFEDIDKMDWTIHFDGLDLFFVDKKLVPDLFDEGFYVQTTWSACFLEKCRMENIHTKELVNPIAFHKRHSIQWNFEKNNKLVEEFWDKYYKTKEGAFEKALAQYYHIILEFTERICYCSSYEKKCLFVLNEENSETRTSIKEQEGVQVTVAGNDVQQGEFDYTIYIKKKVLMDKTFCKLAIYLMEQYDLCELNMGRFFVSLINGKFVYNNLNRNMNIIKEINEESQVFTVVHRNNSAALRKRKMFLPVLYERIEMDDCNIVERRKAEGIAYLMPAGVRANEWYEINRYRLKKIEVKGFLDNNAEKKGKVLAGKSIYSTEELVKNDKNEWVILASKYYNHEIKQQLMQFIDEKRIIDTGYLLKIDDIGDFYYFNLKKYGQQ